MSMASELLRSMRPRQWVKNLFVGAPVLFAQRLTDGRAVGRALAAVAVFCLLSSAGYLLNDVIDIYKDRVHPTKRFRPIASGALPSRVAKICSVAFALLGLSGGLLLDARFAACAAAYFLLNQIAYSFLLKRIVYVDVLTIALGFLLRVTAGAFAIPVWASPWLFVCTGLLACFFGFGKRAHELATSGDRGNEQRDVLSSYRPSHLRIALVVTGAATVAAYVAYTLSDHTREFFHTTRMVWTAPPILLGVTRFMTLVGSRPKAESPTEEVLRDPLSLANFVLWVGAVVAIVYFR